MNAADLPGPAGLTEAAAISRLKTDGFNDLPRGEKRSIFTILRAVVLEPMMLLLLAAGLLYLLLGDRGEALILMLLASVSLVITVVQEVRTEHVLEALRDLTSPTALVIRDGLRKRIPSRNLVVDDLFLIEEGSRVPADGVLLKAQDLQIDESLLTGESLPVTKTLEEASGAEASGLFSGTLTVRGTGMARVSATGAASRIGMIGHMIGTLKSEPPRLLAETRRLVRFFAITGGTVCLLAVILYGLLRGDWLAGLLGGISLAMAMLPEEFPVVLTVFTAMGAWRISRARVLTRTPAAIESLGAATVLCTDKTGTLTENRMSVAELRLPTGARFQPTEGRLPETFRELVLFGCLASERRPFDPMELAFHRLSEAEDCRPDQSWICCRTYGVRPELMAMSQVWDDSRSGGNEIVAAKGAPEAIAALCHLDMAGRSDLLQAANEMASKGLRVLAIARAVHRGDLPESQISFAFEFMGLTGLADPLRTGVAEAVHTCQAAGIRVVMITGDHPVTAQAIAAQAGLSAGTVLRGDEVALMDDLTLSEIVRRAAIFARITPEQKLRIVEALKRNGETVAMTGDGVNDAPSLKAAHIGIAMGGRGTDVAREAAALVLLDDDFRAIPVAIRLGRRIHDNLRKAMCFIVAVHIPIAGLALLPLIFGLPVILGPIHIALLELVIDPVCSLVFENEADESDIMHRPPNARQAPLLPLRLIAWSALQGVVILGLIALFILVTPGSMALAVGNRSAVFIALILMVVILTLVNRRLSASPLSALKRRNPMLLLVISAVMVGLAFAFVWPPARALLGFTTLHLWPLVISLALAIFAFGLLEGLKWLWRSQLKT